MVIRWLAVIVLSLGILVPIGSCFSELRNPGATIRNSQPSFWGFIRFTVFILLIHLWFCSLVLQPISWWRLLIAWFILFNVTGWLYSGFLRTFGKLPPLFETISDLLGVGIGYWLITSFVIPSTVQ
jgi:uncharacterized membrane protein